MLKDLPFLKPFQLKGFRLVLIVAVTFFVLTAFFTLQRHYTFYSTYDQGIFNQVFWNGTQGNFFESSLSSQVSTNVIHGGEVPEVNYRRLGQHFTPALLLWLPFYKLFPTPATLTLLMVTLVTAAGLVLYILARQYLEHPLPTLITLSYYGANGILGPTMGNFHDFSQLPLFVFSLLLALEKRWWWLFAPLLVCIMAVREDSGITLLGIGCYLLISKRYPKLGLGVGLLGVVYTLVTTNILMPLFSDDVAKRFMLEQFGQYVEGDQATTIDIILGIFRNPWILLQELFTPSDRILGYLLGYGLPLAFVPFRSPAAWMIAGFPLLSILLAKGDSGISLNIRYTMSVIPGLFYGTILWWAGKSNFRLWRETWRNRGKSNQIETPPRKLSYSFQRFWKICLILSLSLAILSNPNHTFSFLRPEAFSPWFYISLPEQWSRAIPLHSLVDKIPPDASVAATTEIIPHVSGRREVIRFAGLQLRNDNQQIIDVDYIIVDFGRLQRRSMFSRERDRLKKWVPLIEKQRTQKNYGVLDFQEGVILMKKAIKQNSEAETSWLQYLEEIEPILQRE